MTAPDDLQGDPTNLIIRRRIRPGREQEYEQRVQELLEVVRRHPGHRGTGVLRPAAGHREYTLVSRFDTFSAAAEWELSPDRAAWLLEIEPLVDEQVSFEKQPGLEFWFTPPATERLRQPARWKMLILTLVALYPISVSIALLLAPLTPGWPFLLRSLLQMFFVVSLMTYFVMPLVTRLATDWLKR